MTEIIRPKPFMPPTRDALASGWRRSFVNDATVRVLAILRKSSADEIRLELRAPVSPMKAADYPGGTVAQVMLLAQDTALAEIIDQAIKVDLDGVSQLSLTLPTNFSQAVFIEEGFPIPPASGIFEGLPTGMVKKLALLAPISNELENYSAPAASVVISQLLKTSVGNGGARILLSADPATAAAPAGILNGIAPLSAAASPADAIKALIAAIAAANINTRSVFFVAAPDVHAAFETQSWPLFKRKAIEANVLAPGVLIAIAGAGFVVGGEGVPVVDVSKSGAFHLANPAEQIAPPGGPISAPVVSMFQTDSHSLRCVCRLTWACAPGCVAWMVMS